MKNIITFLLSCTSMLIATGQSDNLPVNELRSTSQTPFVLYLSGDAGFNKFSTGLCDAINKAGYSITALNSKSYFWDKKTPEQTVKDITAYLEKQFPGRKNQQLVMAGYSFGADVLPFIANRLPDSLKRQLISVVMLSPSTSTDFEVHWSDLFGSDKKRSMDVVAEMNKMGSQKTITLFGSDEETFPAKNIRLKNYYTEILPGGHHFDGNTDEVAKKMIRYFK